MYPSMPHQLMLRAVKEYLYSRHVKEPSTEKTMELLEVIKFPLAPMGVLAPGSAHARPSAQPPIDTSGKFSAHMSGRGVKKTPHNPPLKKWLRETFHILQADPKMVEIYNKPPAVTSRQPRSLKQHFVRIRLRSLPFQNCEDLLPPEALLV